ncbi:ATP-grasp domain-containing protein [Halorubellus sp. PRR65]|uniref:carboxylate--amine ligase n=1 Tax=Halorubellus sp. PRR65 TaxID=3098148 RepID=UPI002B25EB79|nr:ATP-grasp domain-containing protein [Halorubellus sp. PRR65]
MPRSTVVVPTGSPASTIACHRSFARQGIRTIGAASDPSAPAFRSRHCDERVVVDDPMTNVTAYKDALLALAARADVETIVPLSEPDIYVLAKYRDAFAEHIATPWPSFETLRTIHDRDRLFAVARDAGVAVPDTRSLDDVDAWTDDCVVKSRFALLSSEYTTDDLPAELVDQEGAIFVPADERPDVDRLRAAFGHTPHVQRFVDGTEYSLGVLYDDGEPVVETQKRIVRGVKYYHGPSVYHETVDIPELETFGRDLLTELDYHGPADIDVIRNPDTGEYELLEINPRFWATVQLEIHAGFDFPTYYWQLATDTPVGPVPDPTPGIRSHALAGELSYLLSVAADDHPVCDHPSLLAATRNVVTSTLRDRRFDVLDARDPVPFLATIANAVRSYTTPSQSPTTPPDPEPAPDPQPPNAPDPR